MLLRIERGSGFGFCWSWVMICCSFSGLVFLFERFFLRSWMRFFILVDGGRLLCRVLRRVEWFVLEGLMRVVVCWFWRLSDILCRIFCGLKWMCSVLVCIVGFV